MVEVLDWLLDSDPSIRWQVMADLMESPTESISAERARVATEGWGAHLLAEQAPNGQWGWSEYSHLVDGIPDAQGRVVLRELHRVRAEHAADFLGVDLETIERWETDPLDLDDELVPRYLAMLKWCQENLGTYNPKWISTTYTLLLLVHLGIEPEAARPQLDLVATRVRWPEDQGPGPFFQGEEEQCVNGMVVATGSYFGYDVGGVVDRLLTESKADGGWNCSPSSRSSFDTTLCVLEGLLAYEERNGSDRDITEARKRAEEYLLERGLFRRKSDGEIADPSYTSFKFPPRWHYDVLRALEYFRLAGPADERCAEAVELVEAKRGVDGRWLLEATPPGYVYFHTDEGDGLPSRWNTLRAMRVLAWANGAQA